MMLLFSISFHEIPSLKTAPGISKSDSSYSVVTSLQSISNGGLPYSMLVLIIKTGRVFTLHEPL